MLGLRALMLGLRALCARGEERAVGRLPAKPALLHPLEDPGPLHEAELGVLEEGALGRLIEIAAELEGVKRLAPEGAEPIPHDVVRDPHAGIAGAAQAELIPFAVADDLHHDVRRLAELPDEVAPVALLVEARRRRDVQAQHHVGGHRRLARRREQPDVRRHEEAPGRAVVARRRTGPARIERLGQQPHLLLGVDIVHRLVVLDLNRGHVGPNLGVDLHGIGAHARLRSKRRAREGGGQARAIARRAGGSPLTPSPPTLRTDASMGASVVMQFLDGGGREGGKQG